MSPGVGPYRTPSTRSLGVKRHQHRPISARMILGQRPSNLRRDVPEICDADAERHRVLCDVGEARVGQHGDERLAVGDRRDGRWKVQ